MADDNEVHEWGPFKFHNRTVNDQTFKIHYQTTGSSSAPQKMVFVMGLMAPMTAWNCQISYFQERGEEFECCFIDNRGIGLSDVPPGPYSTPMMAEDVLSVVRTELGWKRYAVIGASMGGMITQHVGLLGGDEEISHLLLLCTRAQSTFWTRMPPFSTIWAIIRQMMTDPKDLPAQANLVLPTLYSANWLDKDGNRERMKERFIEARTACPPHPDAFNNQFAAVQEHELTDEQVQIIKQGKFKVGAISGDADYLLPHTNTEKMDQLLGAEVKILGGVGHGLAFEAAEDVNAWIIEQLKR